MEDRTLILVAGAARSGTTMLDAMLGANPASFSCGEPFAWFRPFRPQHSVLKCSCEDEGCTVWPAIASGPEDSFHTRVADGLGVETVVDSSKDLDWMADSLAHARAAGIETRVVAIWKDPAELAHSWWKREYLRSRVTGGVSRRKLRIQLDGFASYHAGLFERFPDVVTVPYASLVEAPGDVLQRTCTALDVPYRDGQERFWESDIHMLFGSSSVRRIKDDPNPRIVAAETPPELEPVRATVARATASDERLAGLLSELRRRSVTAG